MDFIIENFEVIMILSIIVLIILIFIVIGLNKYLLSYYLTKKFNIDANYEIDASSGQRRFTIKIYNNNINDVRVAGFGFLYKNHNIDFYNKYLQVNGLPANHKLVIPSRDYINIFITVADLKAIIYEINKGAYKVSKLEAYVTDSLGLTSTSVTKTIKRLLYKDLKHDDKVERQRLKEARLRKELEERKIREKERIEKRLKRRDQINKLKMKFKSFINMFRRKSKSK